MRISTLSIRPVLQAAPFPLFSGFVSPRPTYQFCCLGGLLASAVVYDNNTVIVAPCYKRYSTKRYLLIESWPTAMIPIISIPIQSK
ncbi:MAG: hypothetical protein ABR985_20395 [Methanotrichaceae archaeon]